MSARDAFELTARQQEAQHIIAGDATHIMLFGGSRSGKTFLHIRNIVMRALKAPKSRHAILRFARDHVNTSVFLDTLPAVMTKAFPQVRYDTNKQLLLMTLPNESEIWCGGLADKEQADKILGKEYATIFLNECSQIPFASRETAVTRLAQAVTTSIENRGPSALKPRMYYDCNPPNKAHWTYRLFVQKANPETRMPLTVPMDYAHFQINPEHNLEHQAPGYIDTLRGLSARMQKRFLRGEFADATPNQLFNEDDIDKWRVIDGSVPDFVRVVVAVDPSGSGDIDNADNDEIGIVVAALGTDGVGYILEDCTVKVGPATWGKIAVDAYTRHAADIIVGEVNYGGAMVEHTIRTAPTGGRRPPFKMLHASRGKVVRAEPVSALYEKGKVRHVGYFQKLEDELAAFSTVGYLGDGSPNRADAAVWAVTELFPGLVAEKREKQKAREPEYAGPGGWMA